MSILISVLSLLAAIGSFVYTKLMNDRNKKEQESLRLTVNRLEAESLFDKVRARRSELEEAMSEFSLVESNVNEFDLSELSETDFSSYEATILRCMSKYTALYSEIEAFCARMLDGMNGNEAYLRTEVLPALKQDAMNQASLFGAINTTARALDLSPLPKPDPSSYRSYHAFIQQYCGKDKFWMNTLQTVRYENSFQY